MSGVKRDRDLMKFESGAAEFERKNLQLSGPLLKLLKRNDDAIVSNKDSGENESGEPVETKCTLTLEHAAARHGLALLLFPCI
jgi:hypothetical protein